MRNRRCSIIAGVVTLVLGICGSASAQNSDLVITCTDSADPVILGNGHSYTITVSNAGPEVATSVAVSNRLPAGVSFQTFATSHGQSLSGSGGVYTWSEGTMQPGQSGWVRLNVLATVAGTHTNQATVSTPADDPTPANNSVQEETVVRQGNSDLVITCTDSADPVILGNGHSYTITVSNAGPEVATSVAVSNRLPAGVSFQTFATSHSQSLSGSGGVYTWSEGTMQPGQSGWVRLNVLATVAGTHTNQATVSTPADDPTPANNSVQEETVVRQGNSDLVITCTDSADPVILGNGHSYTITVSNAGPEVATSVAVSNRLPAGVSFQTFATSHGQSLSGSGGVYTWSEGTMQPGQSGWVRLNVLATVAGTHTNQATVKGQ